MNEESFICHDCKRETPIMESSEYGLGLPDPLCQSCMCDLMNGKWDPIEWKQEKEEEAIRPKSREELILIELFGNREERITRTGSSRVNIKTIEQRRQKSKAQRIRERREIKKNSLFADNDIVEWNGKLYLWEKYFDDVLYSRIRSIRKDTKNGFSIETKNIKKVASSISGD